MGAPPGSAGVPPASVPACGRDARAPRGCKGINMITLSLTGELIERINEEAHRLSITPEERIAALLERAVAPAENFQPGKLQDGLFQLAALVKRIPCVTWLS